MIVAKDDGGGTVNDGLAEYFSYSDNSRVDIPLIDKGGRNNPVLIIELNGSHLFLGQVFHLGSEKFICIARMNNLQGFGNGHARSNFVNARRLCHEPSHEINENGILGRKKT